MQRTAPISWHLTAVVTLTFVAFFACVYVNPYSLHRVQVVGAAEFDAPPDTHGRVASGGSAIDFRLPRPSLRRQDLERGGLHLLDDATIEERVAACVSYVRQHLNATDANKPKAPATNAAALLRHGREWLCQCGEHAIVLNEVLQAGGFQSRVLWLEGHVVAEYYHEDWNQWVVVDAHMNTQFEDSEGKRLSAAEAMQRFHLDEPVRFVPIVSEEGETHSLAHSETDHRWYRNILLNGECYAMSGSTLQFPSRWSHLAKFGSPPQLLILSTPYDTSAARFLEPLGFHKIVLVSAAFVGAFYFLNLLLFRPVREAARPWSRGSSAWLRQSLSEAARLTPRRPQPVDADRAGVGGGI